MGEKEEVLKQNSFLSFHPDRARNEMRCSFPDFKARPKVEDDDDDHPHPHPRDSGDDEDDDHHHREEAVEDSLVQKIWPI